MLGRVEVNLMIKTIGLTLCVFLSVVSVINSSQSLDTAQQVTFVRPVGLPFKLSLLRTEDILGMSTYIEYKVENMSIDDVSQICFTLVGRDSQGEPWPLDYHCDSKRVAAKSTIQGRIEIRAALQKGSSSFLIPSRVIGLTGIWVVDIPTLEKNAKNGAFTPDARLESTFEPHISIMRSDKREMLGLMLKDLLHDNHKAQRIPDPENIVLLKDSSDFDVPLLQKGNLLLLTRSEIQEFANNKGRIVYIVCEPFESEGSIIRGRLTLRDQVPATKAMHVPYGFSFGYSFIKRNGKWVVNASSGHSRS